MDIRSAVSDGALASFSAALLLAGCASSPETYRLEAEIGDPLGFPQGATAVRGPTYWTIERRVYARGQTRRVRLSREESLALDAAVADPGLYTKPTPRNADHCIDAPSISLSAVVGGTVRNLSLNCETSPVLETVLDILFGLPKAVDTADPEVAQTD